MKCSCQQTECLWQNVTQNLYQQRRSKPSVAAPRAREALICLAKLWKLSWIFKEVRKEILPPSLCWLLPFASAEAVGPHLSGDSHQQVHPEEKSNHNHGGQEKLPSMDCSLHRDCYDTNLERAPKGSDRDIVWVQWTDYKFLSVCRLWGWASREDAHCCMRTFYLP